MTMFQVHFIAGLMFGIEFPPPDTDYNETFVMTIDLGIVRINMVKSDFSE
jgi:hypothetical protein